MKEKPARVDCPVCGQPVIYFPGSEPLECDIKEDADGKRYSIYYVTCERCGTTRIPAGGRDGRGGP